MTEQKLMFPEGWKETFIFFIMEFYMNSRFLKKVLICVSNMLCTTAVNVSFLFKVPAVSLRSDLMLTRLQKNYSSLLTLCH